MAFLMLIVLPSMTVNVPAASIRTSPAGQAAMALLICVESSLPPPSGLIVAQTVVRVGIPPTDCIPAFFQFAETSFCGGKNVELLPLCACAELTRVRAQIRAVVDPRI